jgi:hypothetical protein
MTPLFKKLNLGTHRTIHVLDAPTSFAAELAALSGVHVHREVLGTVSFALAFVVTQAQVDARSAELVAAVEGDALLWMVYPKGTSKKYRCDFNRDSGWSVLGAAGYEPVRQVAVDEDWSALRFRKAENIKSMTRNPDGAISQLGRRKAQRGPRARP